MKLKVIILLISLLSGSIEAQTIHYNAFSHNDYERPRPLFDALSFQFNCVEADLWLIDGELYVSHDSVAPNPDITFEKLYLLPLVERIKKNGGKVYPSSDRPFYLMVDCKTDGEAMYPVLKRNWSHTNLFSVMKRTGNCKKVPCCSICQGEVPVRLLLLKPTDLSF